MSTHFHQCNCSSLKFFQSNLQKPAILTMNIVLVVVILSLKAMAQTDPSCLKSDAGACSQCADKYFLYEGQCVAYACLTQVSSLSESGIQSSLTYAGGVIREQFGPLVGDCFGIVLSLITNFDQPNVLQQLDAQSTTSGVVLTLPLEQLQKLPCDHLETSDAFVTQCFLSLEMQIKQKTQYEYRTVMQLYINKQFSDQVIFDNQGFSATDAASTQLKVVSEAEILQQVMASATDIYIVAQQILRDPHFYDKAIQFVGAQLISADAIIPLYLVNSTLKGSIVTYTLLLNQSLGSLPHNQKLQIQSNLISTSRMLQQQDAVNGRPKYVMSTSTLIDIVDGSTQTQGERKQNGTPSQEQKNHQDLEDYFGYCIVFMILTMTTFCLTRSKLVVTQVVQKQNNEVELQDKNYCEPPKIKREIYYSREEKIEVDQHSKVDVEKQT